MSSRRSATAPRRARRAQGSEDDEPEQDTQAEEAEPRERKPVKKPKSKRGTSRRAGSDEEEDEDDDIPEIDVDNFNDQPLQKDAAVKLNGAISDWEMAQGKIKGRDKNPFDFVTRAAEVVTEYGDEQAGPVRARFGESYVTRLTSIPRFLNNWTRLCATLSTRTSKWTSSATFCRV